MITTRIRFAVIAIALILLSWTIYEQVYEISALAGFGIMFLIYGYYKEGTVLLAAKAYHNKDLEKAEKLLREVKNPDRLLRKRRGYYEFMLGNIELKKENFSDAERHFQIASRFQVKNENEKGLILLQLANLNFRKKEFDKAKAYTSTAKELKISSRVKHIIEKLELEIEKAT